MFKKIFPSSKKSVFRYFIFSYIIVILVPTILLVVIYFITANNYKTETIKQSQASFENTIGLYELSLDHTKDMITQISLDKTIKNLMTHVYDIDGPNLYRVRETWNTLKTYTIKNDIIKDIYIYFEKSNTIISPDVCAINMPLFYSVHLDYEDMDYSTFRNEFLVKPHNYTTIPSKKIHTYSSDFEAITLVKSLPVDYPSYIGTALVLIDTDTLVDILQKDNISKDDYYIVLNSNGEKILATNNTSNNIIYNIYNKINEGLNTTGTFTQEIDFSNTLVTYSKGQKSGWIYISIKPIESVMRDYRFIFVSVALTSIIALLIGLALAYYMAYRTFQPIKNIYSKLSNDNKDDNNITYTSINGSINRLLNDRRALVSTISDQRTYMISGFIERFLHGNFISDIDIIHTAAMSGLDLSNKNVFPILISLPKYITIVNIELVNEITYMMSLVIETMNKLSQPYQFQLHLITQRPGHIVGFITFDNRLIMNYQESISKFWNSALDKLTNEFNITPILNCGTCCNKLVDVPSVYREISDMAVFETDNLSSKPIFLGYKTIENSFFYPINFEIRLTNSVKSGNVNAVEPLFDQLIEENTRLRTLNQYFCKHLLHEVSGTFLKIYTELELDSPNLLHTIDKAYEDLDSNHNIRKFLYTMKNIYVSVTNTVLQQQDQDRDVIKNQILDMINESYNKSSFSLQSMADSFGFSFTYMSHYFKELVGEKFSTYILNLRMKNAAKLLIETDEAISTISNKVSYDNVSSFRRAFNRYYGISPTSYRSLKK